MMKGMKAPKKHQSSPGLYEKNTTLIIKKK